MSEVFVYTVHQTGGVGAWSRYEFPYQIDEIAQLDGQLYLRAGNKTMRVTADVMTDETAAGVHTPFDGIIQWAWLDFGSPGLTKQMVGVDIVGTPLASFAKILATSDAPQVFNGYCGAESGTVPVSAISPAILVSEIEVQKKNRARDLRPLLSRPEGGSK